MRARVYILGMALVLLALVAWLHRPKHRAPESGQAPEVVQPSKAIAIRERAPAFTSGANALATNVPLPANVSAWTAAQINPEQRKELFQQLVEEQNVPFDFYGKVVDQGDQPVPDAKVKLSVRQWYVQSLDNLNAEGRSILYEKLSDKDGFFNLSEGTGDTLTVESVEKDGYQLSAKTSRSYGAATSPGSPVIFKMWKRGPKETLITGQKVFGIIPDGRVYTLDLLQGKKIEGDRAEGDLRISIVRPADATPQGKYQWSYKLEGVQGGLIETDDEFMYLAPENGYEPKFATDLAPADEAWTPLAKKQFFFRSRYGRIFGRMQVEVNAIYNDKSALEVNYAVNPAGSRNLQP